VTTPPFYANLLRGIALAANGTAYSWYSDGVACRGKATMLCTEEFEYSAPLNEFRYFLGMGMNAANHVYTWHDQLYYTIGDPANLTSRKSWGGGFSPAPFNASQMIGVFNINSGVLDPVGRWYFYFQEANNVVYRTIGTAGDADHYEGPKQVTISSQHGPILGIDYNRNNGRVYTWYKDGTLNSSTSTLNLAQN
jgi:hypothetical protein